MMKKLLIFVFMTFALKGTAQSDLVNSKYMDVATDNTSTQKTLISLIRKRSAFSASVSVQKQNSPVKDYFGVSFVFIICCDLLIAFRAHTANTAHVLGHTG